MLLQLGLCRTCSEKPHCWFSHDAAHNYIYLIIQRLIPVNNLIHVNLFLTGLPRNGGAGAGRAHANGIRGGWDGNPRTLHMFHHSWQDPLGGRSLPVGWNGDFGSISHLFG